MLVGISEMDLAQRIESSVCDVVDFLNHPLGGCNVGGPALELSEVFGDWPELNWCLPQHRLARFYFMNYPLLAKFVETDKSR